MAEGVVDTACSNEMTQFYMAELVAALEYMHSHVSQWRDANTLRSGFQIRSLPIHNRVERGAS